MATENNRIGKQAFIEEVHEGISEYIDISKTSTADIVNTMIEVVTDILQRGDDLVIPGFGSLKVQEVKARKGRNVATGEIIKIAAHKKVKFKAGKILNETVNAKKAKKKK